MSAITATEVSSGGRYGAAFWERLWRTAGLQFVGLCIIAYFVYGNQPQAGASPDTLAAFYSGGRTRILIAASISGLAVLYLMWFAAAVRATLADAGEDGWGSALTGASAAVGAVFLLIIAVVAALAYSIARCCVTVSSPPFVIMGTAAVTPLIGLRARDAVIVTMLPPVF